MKKKLLKYLFFFQRLFLFFLMTMNLNGYSCAEAAEKTSTQYIEVEGEMVVVFYDDFNHHNQHKNKSKVEYRVLAKGKNLYQLLLAKNPHTTVSAETLIAGSVVHIKGNLINDHDIQVKEIKLIRARKKALVQSAPVVRKVAYVLVDLIDAKASLDFTTPELTNILDNVETTYQQVSFGKLLLPKDGNGDGAYDVFGPIAISESKTSCNIGLWGAKADAAAKSLGIDYLTGYDTVQYIMSKSVSCGWAGVAYGYCMGNISTCRSWIKSSTFDVSTHELGHNIGMGHSGTDVNNDDVFEDAYGDRTDPQGYPIGKLRGFSPPHVVQHNWLSHYPEAIKNVNANGTFDLIPLSIDPSIEGKTQILITPKLGSKNLYYIAYLQPVGIDSLLESKYTKGVSIYLYNPDRKTNTLDDTAYVKTLTDGEIFTAGSLQITQLPRNGDSTHVGVNINMNSCKVITPTLTFIPGIIGVAPGLSANYQLKIKNNDYPGCGATSFNLSSLSLPTGFSVLYSPQVLTLVPGAEGVSAVTVTVGTTLGLFSFTAQVSDVSTNPSHAASSIRAQILVNNNGQTIPQAGVNSKLYKGSWTVLPNFDLLTPASAGRLGNFSIDALKGTDKFGLSFEGLININIEGAYTFYTASDDGSKLLIDGQLVVVNDGRHGVVTKSGVITLSSGYHTIRIEYFDATGGESLSVYYQVPGTVGKVLIPNSILSSF